MRALQAQSLELFILGSLSAGPAGAELGIVHIRVVLGLYCIIIGDILGLYWDNGKENGNYYLGFRV